jgi:hypothetical protein
MTTENRIVFDVGDITQIRIECARCHASVALQLGEDRILVPQQCPGCRETWKDDMRKGVAHVIEDVAASLKHLKSISHTPCTLRFEIAASS